MWPSMLVVAFLTAWLFRRLVEEPGLALRETVRRRLDATSAGGTA
jgi:peptidoglycan/LPS O-acetylase OafA/YrhL